MTTNLLVRGIVQLVNNTILDEDDDCEALLSFDDRIVPAPLNKIYLAFLIGKDSVSLFTDETDNCCQRTQITVSMNCYAPPGESAIHVCSLAETVLDKLNIEYGGMMSGYEIGQAVIDDYLKALKIPCKMFFVYEQCPAFNLSDSRILPFADFLCKTHVNDSSIHLSSAERDFLSQPFVCGNYAGLGAYNDQTVNIGFKPKLLIIFPDNDPFAVLGSLNNLICYADIAFQGASNSFITLTSNGFSVRSPENIQTGSSQRVLNEAGRNYNYIAFK